VHADLGPPTHPASHPKATSTTTNTPSFTPNLKSINSNQPESAHSIFSNTKSEENYNKTIQEQKEKNKQNRNK
jgi:hypothetical protein